MRKTMSGKSMDKTTQNRLETDVTGRNMYYENLKFKNMGTSII